MASVEATDDDLLNRLRDTVQDVISKNNKADSKAVQQIMESLVSLKSKYETLSPSEKEEFSQQMQDSFEKTIFSIESNVAEQAPYEQHFFHCSLLIYVAVVITFALFGYKLYKSLMEKKLKKQEKQKNNKKSKKIKQK